MPIVTILGCGSSGGVPVIACECLVCKTPKRYNKRKRCAILINDGSTNILVDFGFDIKDQLVRARVKHLDAAILTHVHADHVSGIDNLRTFSFKAKKPLDIYTGYVSVEHLKLRYDYLFNDSVSRYFTGHLPSVFTFHPNDPFAKIQIKDITIQFFNQDHGDIDSLGLRINDFVYSVDVLNFPPESERYLQDMGVWIVDCLDYTSNHAHAGLDRVLQWVEKYRPRKTYLTNMGHRIDYYNITKDLPKNVKPLHDGLKFKI